MKQIKTFIFVWSNYVDDYPADENDAAVNSWLEKNRNKITNVNISSNVSYSIADDCHNTVMQITISYDKVKYQQKPK